MIASDKIELVEQIGLEWKPWQPEKLTVRQITSKLKRAMREGFSNLIVTGEVSGLKAAASGHLYFNLKEEDTVLPCVMYRQAARLLKFPVRDGVMLEVRGSIDIYEPRGAYQFLVESASPVGIGALQQAFEALKRKLADEGLFAAERKRPLPRFPRRIGIITSPTGAVIQDMLNIFARRSPGLEIRIFPTLVQGAGCAEGVVAGLEYFSSVEWADVVVVARGGGSLEDLWGFNEEIVARAIAASRVPVVSAVGHETDFTIADFVADLRAPTPSAAAELIAPDVAQLLEGIAAANRAMHRSVRHLISQRRESVFRYGVERAQALLSRRLNRISQQIDEADSRAAQILRDRLWRLRMLAERHTMALHKQDRRLQLLKSSDRLATLRTALDTLLRRRLATSRERAATLAAQLHQLNPTQILSRGFALVFDENNQLVRSAKSVAPGQRLRVRVNEGEIGVKVDEA
jgi:exodeoxyribonuclease VII large subunit